MSTARFSIIKYFGKGTNTGSFNTKTHAAGSCGHIVARGDFGAFNATTNPEGIRGLGASDTIVVAVVGADIAEVPVRLRSTGTLRLEHIRLYADATLTLGTANNILFKIIRGSGSVLPNVTLATVAESSLTANNYVAALTDANIVIEEGDKIAIVPDGALDGTAAATTDIYVEVVFKRITSGGRLSEGTAVA